ncbi:hypothetical protein KM043_013817 [Ampulex compressa]|nr:hypothetical protein KM043_013817 [Ampulex compressa]
MLLEMPQRTQKSIDGSTQEEFKEDDTKVEMKMKSKSATESKDRNDVICVNTDNRAVANFPLGRNPIQVLIDYNNALRIKDGNVQTITCPEDKCTSEALPGQVRDLVNEELFTKYDSILLSTMLETGNVVYCPRRSCQYPVSIENNEELATCPACEYAFCIYCKTLYHGIEPCKVNSVEKKQLVLAYQEASSEEKLLMQQRYGKKTLQMLTENFMSEHWINDNTKTCPRCNIAIQKSEGCNKMTCWRCDTFFCWLCGTVLQHKNPYSHYNTPYSECTGKLYHGIIPDEME